MAKKGSSDTIRLDFGKEVEGGGGGIRLPENDYKGKILKIKKIRASEKDTPGLAVTIKITDGKFSGKKITDRLWITPKSLWRIRSMLEALGLTVPKKAINLPTKKLIGKELGITVIDDEPYQGRIKSKIGDFVDLETLADLYDDEDEDEDDEDLDDEEAENEDDDEEEEDDEDEEDEEDEDEDDLEEMSRKELKQYIKENDLEVKVTKKMDEDEIREAISEASDSDDDDEEDEDDELDLDDF